MKPLSLQPCCGDKQERFRRNFAQVVREERRAFSLFSPRTVDVDNLGPEAHDREGHPGVLQVRVQRATGIRLGDTQRAATK